jgi:DNA repair protein RecN (Recombination protein N)
MLRHLSIQNFAIIESIEIDFESGLNIIIGETGTGKSIIIDSLSILLGEKALTSYIREGFKKAIIEGIFDLRPDNPVWAILSENEIDPLSSEESENKYFSIIIRREISTTGNSRIFINDTPAQYSLLKTIGELIIDFHGQFEHQSLINPANHLPILDAFLNNFHLLKLFKQKLSELRTQISLFKSFNDNRNVLLNELSLKKRILDEINEVNPLENEDVELEKDLKLLNNSESIHLILIELSELLINEETSLNNKLNILKKKLEQITKYEDNFSSYNSELSQYLPFFSELANYLDDYIQNFSFDPKRVEEINQRLYSLQQLKRKFGTLNEIIEMRDKLKNEIEELSVLDNSENTLLNSISVLYNECCELSKELSKTRIQNKSIFEGKITELLRDLGFTFIDFQIKIQTNEIPPFEKEQLNNIKFNNSGIDNCEFLISTNLGESAKELARIASGGELSRIMLALKALAATDNNLQMLVFDEIDAGVSGRIAQKVGETMRNLGKYHQIICITHSPQVSAAGNCIISIEKIEVNSRTLSISRKLNEEDKVLEIAKFLSGSDVSDSALVSASALLKNYKN